MVGWERVEEEEDGARYGLACRPIFHLFLRFSFFLFWFFFCSIFYDFEFCADSKKRSDFEKNCSDFQISSVLLFLLDF
jgi:hypothetical protein